MAREYYETRAIGRLERYADDGAIQYSVGPIIPAHFEAATRKWVAGIIEDFSLETYHFKILVKAAEAHDRGEEARKILKSDGIVIT